MAIYRCVAEKLVDIYDFDWRDNLKMKEACICSVESLIANGINVGMIVVLAIVTGLWTEIAIYFLTFAAMRFYAGGAHAKNYIQCITIYVCVMLMSVIGAKYVVWLGAKVILVVCLSGIHVSGYINGRYAARQKNVGKKSQLFHKRAMLMHGVITTEMFGLFVMYLQTSNYFVAQILIIQSCALLAQSIALWLGRKEVRGD